MPRIPRDVRAQIVAYRDAGLSYRAIGERVGYSFNAVRYWCQVHVQQEGRLWNIAGGAPERATTEDEDLQIVAVAQGDPFTTAGEIRNVLGLQCSESTIRRRLRECGLRSFVAARKERLTAVHRAGRLDFANEHSQWRQAEWREVMFSDESYFTSFYDHRLRVWRLRGQRYSPSNIRDVQRSGRVGVPVWACMSAHGLGPLVRIEGRLEFNQYMDILDHTLTPYALDGPYPDGDYLFMHDRSPIHRAGAVQQLLEDRVIRQLPWPAKGAELNPMENVWGLLKRRLSRAVLPVRTADAVWDQVVTYWEELKNDRELNLAHRLVSSMPDRLQMIIDAQGGPIKY